MSPDLLLICLTVLALGAGAMYVWLRREARRAVANTAHAEVLGQIGQSLAALHAQAPRPASPPLTGKTVVVHTRKPDDQSVRGIVTADHADQITLSEALFYREGGGQQTAGGDVSVKWINVSTFQVVTPPEE